MRITIHPGTRQIGGCVTEYEFKGFRLFVDYGEQLTGVPRAAEPLKIEGLTHGDVSKSALLITHYHGDHIGKIAELPSDLPIFMGAVAKEIAFTYSCHMGYKVEDKKRLAERLKTVRTFSHGEKFTFGLFSILPIMIDHSAFDAYAFKIEAQDVSVFHTGDFRTHGFQNSKFAQLLKEYVGKVDYMVCEATNVGCPTSTSVTEKQLLNEFVKEFSTHKINIVYVSSTNIDRLFALYQAACKTGRVFLVDPYQKSILDTVAHGDFLCDDSSRYSYQDKKLPCIVNYNNGEFRIPEGMMQRIEEEGYVLVARAGDKFDNIITNLPGKEKNIYLSMWSGYIDKDNASYNPDLAAAVGDHYKYIHTSGHCDMESLVDVIGVLNPLAIIPIHTDDPKGFAKLFCERWPVILLEDGESIEPCSSRALDSTVAVIYAKGERVQDKCWALDTKTIGFFNGVREAQYILDHVVYAPDRVICYAAEEEEDMEALRYVIMDKNHQPLTKYLCGGHAPGGGRYQEPTPFKPGDKVLAIIQECRNLVVEAEVIGPVDEKLMWEYVKDDCIYDSFKEYRKKLHDWDWDCVAIKPLCDCDNPNVNIESLELPQRIYLFPTEG